MDAILLAYDNMVQLICENKSNNAVITVQHALDVTQYQSVSLH